MEEIDKTCPHIPPTQENLSRFGKLIKTTSMKHIPRGVRKMYIPCWSEESQKLLEEYEKTQDQETAEKLLTSLEENRRERWIEVVENMDMSRSSRHAWQTMKKIDPEKSQPTSAPQIGADEVAKEIKQRGQHTPDHSFEKKMRKEYQNIFRSLPKTDSVITSPISEEDMSEAIKNIKNGNAAGIDGIYPDMITHLGPKAKEWLAIAMTDVIDKSRYPQEWKHARVIAILKPGKPATEPSSYRPISLLCCLYKLLERILLTRITPYVNPHIPIEQAGFRPQRSTTEQVLALTCYIEAGYERKEKTGAVLIDLSAAYDTVWTGGLMLKLAKIIPCRKTLKLLQTMTGTRQFHVVLGGNESKTRKIKNGVPQGSVLAPTLFNVYINDMPATQSLKLGYADDWVLAHQSREWKELETVLSHDTTALKQFFDRWYLRMNTTKTISTTFHLNNHEAEKTLKIQAGNKTLPTDKNPKYLGVTLDRCLTYKKHLEDSAKKIATRNSLLRKLTGRYILGSRTESAQDISPCPMLQRSRILCSCMDKMQPHQPD